MEKDEKTIEVRVPGDWQPGQELTHEQLLSVYKQQIEQLEEDEVMVLMTILLMSSKQGTVSFSNASSFACCAMLKFPKRVYEILGRFYGKKKAKEMYEDLYEYAKNKKNNETT